MSQYLLFLRLHYFARPTAHVSRMACDISSGLAHMHRGGLVHRDIKPENILVFEYAKNRFTAKLSDFGMSQGEFGLLPDCLEHESQNILQCHGLCPPSS